MTGSSMFLAAAAQSDSTMVETVNGLLNSLGVDIFDNEIDQVIFQTNDFLTDGTFVGSGGPFWWILEMCMALGALFALIMAAGMAYKMMVKGEPFDVLKIMRVLGIAIVMAWWYPHGPGSPSVLGVLAYVPNCVGSYTHDLYAIEAEQVQQKFTDMMPYVTKRDSMMQDAMAAAKASDDGSKATGGVVSGTGVDTKEVLEQDKKSSYAWISSVYAGLMVMLDKIIMCFSLVVFRIGWWGTIYVQQIMLGVLTIFGPLTWAFSILPKWESAWAKWIARYLSVHFIGAMLYFVGFYVLLLFDIVASIQYENLVAITESQQTFAFYLQNTVMTGLYLLVASCVSLKCLQLVPDLASWIVPEGETSFAARGFGEGVATEMRGNMMRIAHL